MLFQLSPDGSQNAKPLMLPSSKLFSKRQAATGALHLITDRSCQSLQPKSGLEAFHLIPQIGLFGVEFEKLYGMDLHGSDVQLKITQGLHGL